MKKACIVSINTLILQTNIKLMNKKILFSLLILIFSISVFAEIGTYSQRIFFVKKIDTRNKDEWHFPQKSVKSFNIPFVAYFNRERNSLLIDDKNIGKVYQYQVLDNGNIVTCGFISSNIELSLPVSPCKAYVLFIYINGSTYKGFLGI